MRHLRNFLIALAAVALIVGVTVYFVGGTGVNDTRVTVAKLEAQANELRGKVNESERIKALTAEIEALKAGKVVTPAPADVTLTPVAPAAPAAPRAAAQYSPGSPEYADLSARVAAALGPVQGGGTVKGFSVTEDASKFTCPDGSAGRQIGTQDVTGFTLKRWSCPKQRAVAR